MICKDVKIVEVVYSKSGSYEEGNKIVYIASNNYDEALDYLFELIGNFLIVNSRIVGNLGLITPTVMKRLAPTESISPPPISLETEVPSEGIDEPSFSLSPSISPSAPPEPEVVDEPPKRKRGRPKLKK